ncbi:MAG: HAMP domain-containing histidine kinase, partial [Parcubacteria group bacterium]|nr:HAMP domain-containing histidine kinase [Parcubacteria group bacterium]
EKMQTVFFSADQMVKLVSDLLNLSRIESGKIKYEFARLNLVAIVRNIIQELSGNAAKKNISVKFSGNEKMISALSLDRDKMREVAINLLDNAIKYSPEGSTVEANIAQIPKTVRFSVKDGGIGIKPEDRAKLFTKFVRTEEAAKKDPSGMGIGLYFVKRVIDDHGGNVGVESEGVGKGSTFFVELPVRQK